ncbi:GNAT family N-acetyltransferase, partial [Ralstonia pseudosolanacearum]
AAAGAAARAQGLRRSRLVAVQGADVFWRRLGYRPASADAAQQQALHAVYGDEAQLMERTAFARS